MRCLDDRGGLDYSLDPDRDDRNLLAMGVGDLFHEAEQLEKSIEDLTPPAGMGEFDTAAFFDRLGGTKAEMRLKIRACYTILERVRTRCLYYATRIESQNATADSAAEFFVSVQNEVHNYYAERCDAGYRKLRKAASLVGSTEPEDHALLLTSIRRAVKAVADFHYPPATDPVVCQDGETRRLGKEEYLNRLQEFCAQQLSGSTSTKLLGTELDHLVVFLRHLNDVASKGVHAEVTGVEARQGLLGLYLFLSNLIARIEHKPS